MKINDYYTSIQRQSAVQLTPGSNIYGAFWSHDFFFEKSGGILVK